MRRFHVILAAALGVLLFAATSDAAPPLTATRPLRPIVGGLALKSPTTLKVCAQGTCREGLGSWLTDTVTVAPGARNQPHDFSWSTTAAGISAARWQVANKPFGSASDRSGLVSEGDAGSPQFGRFTLTFTALPPLPQQGRMRFVRPRLNLIPPRYYVRIVPLAASQPVSQPSNTITIEFPQTAPPQTNPLAFHTTLKGCVQDQCSEGLGAWPTDSITVAPQSRTVARQFMWTTDAPDISGARWQVASKPFTGGADSLDGVISAGDAGSQAKGGFTLTFTNLPPLVSASGRVTRRLSPGAVLPHYYVRLIPMMDTKPANTISNTVRVDFPESVAPQENPLVILPTDVYTVSILNFETIKPQTLPWGCVIITGVDYSKLKALPGAYILYKQYLDSGQPVCPKSYKGMGQKPWYESLWDFASGGVSWVSTAYANVKKTAIKVIVTGINAALPGNPCGSKCEAGLTVGLDTGLVALGVPPNLPNMEELTNNGMNYLVQVAASQAGIDCDTACQNAIRSGIKDMAKQVSDKTVASYCGDVELAHSNGAEPLCLPPGVTAKPAPGSANQPAHISIRITRKPNANVYSSLAPDRLRISVWSVVPSSAGHSFGVPTNTCYTDTSVFPCDVEMIKIGAPISGKLFADVLAELPRIKPGDTLDYTFYLSPAAYWLPGHQEMMAAKGASVQYNDWWHLYQGAKLTIAADVECPRTIGTLMASCVKQKAVLYKSIPGKAN